MIPVSNMNYSGVRFFCAEKYSKFCFCMCFSQNNLTSENSWKAVENILFNDPVSPYFELD